VFHISENIGRFDLLVMAVFRNVSEILEIINKMRLLKSIEKVQGSLTDETYFPLREEYTNIQFFVTENP